MTTLEIAAIAGENTVGAAKAIGATNEQGFKGVIGAIQDDLPSSINTAMTPFVTRFAQIQNTIGQIEAIQGGRRFVDEALELQSQKNQALTKEQSSIKDFRLGNAALFGQGERGEGGFAFKGFGMKKQNL